MFSGKIQKVYIQTWFGETFLHMFHLHDLIVFML